MPTQAKTHRHELIKTHLGVLIARALPDHRWMGFESSKYLSARTLLKPDLARRSSMPAMAWGNSGFIDAERRLTHIHRGAGPGGWASVERLTAKAALTHPALPHVSARLDAI